APRARARRLTQRLHGPIERAARDQTSGEWCAARARRASTHDPGAERCRQARKGRMGPTEGPFRLTVGAGTDSFSLVIQDARHGTRRGGIVSTPLTSLERRNGGSSHVPPPCKWRWVWAGAFAAYTVFIIL